MEHRGELDADLHSDDVDFVFHAAHALVLGRSVLEPDPANEQFLVRAVDTLILPALRSAAGRTVDRINDRDRLDPGAVPLTACNSTELTDLLEPPHRSR